MNINHGLPSDLDISTPARVQIAQAYMGARSSLEPVANYGVHQSMKLHRTESTALREHVQETTGDLNLDREFPWPRLQCDLK